MESDIMKASMSQP